MLHRASDIVTSRGVTYPSGRPERDRGLLWRTWGRKQQEAAATEKQRPDLCSV
jgi:hypothetical protein